MMKNIIVLLCLVALGTVSCGENPPTFDTGPNVSVDIGIAEAEVGVTLNTKGDIVLSGNYNQKLAMLGPVGIGWSVGFEQVLNEAQREEASLFILWEDGSGEIWREQYVIGEPFRVTFNDQSWVREIRSEGNSILVAVEPVGSTPDYNDLRSDIQSLIEKWDQAHYNADRYWETNSLSEVLSGDALKDQTETVTWLQSNNCYWEIYELMTPEIVYFEQVGSNSLLVDVRKNWDMDLYCNGSKDNDDDGYFTMRYNIDQINGSWYITEKRVIANH